MKSVSRSQSRRVTLQLQQHRAQADERIAGRCDIVGSMIGVKVTKGEVLPRPCITYLVREKVPWNELAPHERIPPRFQVSGTSILTDVLVWPFMRRQNLSQGTFIRDGFTQGTLTAFAESQFGLWGLSCAHCMLGPDRNANTSAEIQMFDRGAGTFEFAGTTTQTLHLTGGAKIGGSRGYIDCGLFSLSDQSLRSRGQAAKPMATVDLASLRHQRLVGVSVMGSDPNRTRFASVIGVDQYGITDYSDVVLMVDPPGTVHGDSGMLWLTSDGRAAAIHCEGESKDDGSGSLKTTAMSAQRAAEVLQISLRRA
ncbi:hypothetical protein [Variovorax sp. Sphag1AA]|uniref:hypothetical protein n=1 Tax=Variovorax sp. Sphag1AA TaxID=2587027 RepID=UPI001614B43D|nr:hypothetical protein [Variovorax sp. Sphag1AA]MBB3181979.1 hypothetical protein [Variovorax sp. Sphag1AA]